MVICPAEIPGERARSSIDTGEQQQSAALEGARAVHEAGDIVLVQELQEAVDLRVHDGLSHQ